MRSKEYWINWIKAAGIRALRTFAQAFLSCITTSAVLSEVRWVEAISASVLAALVSILMSITGLPEVEEVE